MLSVVPVIGAKAVLNVADFLVAGIGADGADILHGVATMHGEVSAKRSGHLMSSRYSPLAVSAHLDLLDMMSNLFQT